MGTVERACYVRSVATTYKTVFGTIISVKILNARENLPIRTTIRSRPVERSDNCRIPSLKISHPCFSIHSDEVVGYNVIDECGKQELQHRLYYKLMNVSRLFAVAENWWI